MMSICNCIREDDPKVVDQNKCKRLSQELYNAGENKAGTNEDKFYDILTKTSGVCNFFSNKKILFFLFSLFIFKLLII